MDTIDQVTGTPYPNISDHIGGMAVVFTLTPGTRYLYIDEDFICRYRIVDPISEDGDE